MPPGPFPSRQWPRFALGVGAPFALSLLFHLTVGTGAAAWMLGTGWLALFVLGLVAGLQHRHWGFLGGIATAAGAFAALGFLHGAGWLSIPS